MKVVSLFDGVSCAFVALQKANIPITSYTAYEIDKYAIKVSQKNHPSIQHKGDVKNLTEAVECDILIGGSPCTDLSVAKKERQGLQGTHSKLFWEYVRIKNLLKPKWFILENVASMRDSDRDIISEAVGVKPIMICASLVSAQRRKRYFWTNIPTALPEDKGILLKNILEEQVDEKFYMKTVENSLKSEEPIMVSMIGRRLDKDGKRCDYDMSVECKQRIAPKRSQGKSGALTGVQKDNLVLYKNRIRRLTPLESERLQGLPDGYTAGISDTQRYKCCGNAFNCDVIAHILMGIGQDKIKN